MNYNFFPGETLNFTASVIPKAGVSNGISVIFSKSDLIEFSMSNNSTGASDSSNSDYTIGKSVSITPKDKYVSGITDARIRPHTMNLNCTDDPKVKSVFFNFY